MTIANLLAVVPVTDIDIADAWYEKLFGRPATKGVQLSNIVDPDGNSITLIGNFREKY